MWKQSAEPHLENGASAGLAQWYWTVGSLSCRVARQWPPCGTGISCLSELVPETCIPLRRLEGVWDRQTLHFSFEVKLLGNDVLQSSVSVAVWWAPQANCLMNLISGLQNWCSLWPWGSCAPVSLMAKSQETVMKAWHYAAVACFLKPLPRDGAVAVELPSNWGNQKAQSSTLSLHILQKRIGVWRCFDTASSSNSAFKPEHLRCYVSCSAQQRMALSWVPFYTGLSSNPEVHFKPLFCFQEYKKLVSKEKMKPWYTDISVCVATELPLSCIVLEVLGSLTWQIGEGVLWGRQTMLVVELRWQCCFPGPWFLPWPVINFNVDEYLLCLRTHFPANGYECVWLFSFQPSKLNSFPLGTFLCSLHIVTWEGSSYLCQSLAK